jgi:hypothetical protein
MSGTTEVEVPKIAGISNYLSSGGSSASAILSALVSLDRY